MANKLVNVDNLTYCGKEGQEIFSKSVYNLDIAQIGITLKDNVKGKEKIYNGEIGDVWQAYTCPFTPAGEVKLGESFIEPVKIKVNLEECYDAWADTYFVEQTKIALDGGMPQTFADWFFDKLKAKMEREYQEIFWQGDTTRQGTTKKYLKVTDGIEKRLVADHAKVITGSKITVDNVIAQVEAVILKGLENAAEQEVETVDYKVFMNYADVKLLEVALGKLTSGISSNDKFSNYSMNGGNLNIMGFDVVPTMCSRSTIIFGPVKNIVLGFDTFDSHIEYRLIDMRETTGDDQFRVIALTNIAVGEIFGDLFVVSHK